MNNALASEPRAVALLGEEPRLTLIDGNDPGTCLSIRLVRTDAAQATWLGIVDDRAALLDRVRMGLKPSFVVHHDADLPTISGELDVKILGPVGAQDAPRAAARLLRDQPFGLGRAVLIEVAPRALALAPWADGGTIGAVPRT